MDKRRDSIFVVKMKKPMSLFYFSITLAICSSVLYHFVAKSTPASINFSVSLLVTYVVSFGVVLLTLIFMPMPNGLAYELSSSTGRASGWRSRSWASNSASC